MSSFIENVRQDIERHGCSVIFVADEDPPFAYTLGLWERHKHAEFIVFGLSGSVMTNILNAIARKVREGGNFSSAVHLADVGGKFGLRVVPIHEAGLSRYFGFALGYYQGPFPAAQVVWPDSAGVFPGDAKIQCCICGPTAPPQASRLTLRST
jgi:Domain of unknown function (DUF4262)